MWRSVLAPVLSGLAFIMAGAGASPAAMQGDARQSRVDVQVAPEVVSLGEPFTVRIRVRAPKVATIRFPEVPEPASGVDPIDPRAIEEGPIGDIVDRTALYTFVAWDIGHRGPVFEPVVVTVAGQERRFSVGAPGVTVRSRLPADSAAQVPRDARDPVRLPGRLWQYVVLGAIAAVGAAWYLVRRRERLASSAAPLPEPWVQARTAFSSLAALQLIEAGEPGRHVIAHVDVLRAYLERRFPVIDASLDASAATAMMSAHDFPLPVQRLTVLLTRDATLRFAQSEIGMGEAAALAAEAREITTMVQLAHEARVRDIERPPRPRRR